MIYDLVAKYVLSIDPQAVVRFSNGSIEIESSVVTSTVEEMIPDLALLQLRIQRNLLIEKTDWWCVSDRTPTNEQLIYRQQLRDLPANSTPALDENGNLTGVDWPTPPTS